MTEKIELRCISPVIITGVQTNVNPTGGLSDTYWALLAQHLGHIHMDVLISDANIGNTLTLNCDVGFFNCANLRQGCPLYV